MPGVIGQLGMGFALVGDEGHVISACGRYAEMVGRTPSDCIGMTLNDCTHPEDIASVEWMIEQARKHGEVAEIRKRYVRPDGSILWVDQHVQFLQGTERRFLHVSMYKVKCIPNLDDSDESSGGYAEYIQSLSGELAEMARKAYLPVTCDLLDAASHTAAVEGGVEAAHPETEAS